MARISEPLNHRAATTEVLRWGDRSGTHLFAEGTVEPLNMECPLLPNGRGGNDFDHSVQPIDGAERGQVRLGNITNSKSVPAHRNCANSHCAVPLIFLLEWDTLVKIVFRSATVCRHRIFVHPLR